MKEHNLCSSCLGAKTSQVCKFKKDCKFCRVRHHRLLHYGKRVLTTQKSAINSAAPLSQENHEHDGPYVQSKCSSSELSPSIEEPVLNKVYGLGRDSSLLLSPPELDSLAFINSSESKLPSNSGILLDSNTSRVLNSRVIEIFLRVIIDPCLQASFISGSLSQMLNLITDATVPIKGTGSISLSVQKFAHALIKHRFDSPFSCHADTFIFSSISSNTPSFSI